jgi:hypothetical protein
MPPPSLDARFCASQPYQPFYCEENVWRLLQNPAIPTPGAALFVTNPHQTVAVYGQRHAIRDPVIWDYHVVLLLPRHGQVLDLDDREPGARPLADWLARAFRRTDPAQHQAHFRMVPGPEFLRKFSSDRSHMRTADGRLRQPAPPWPAPFQPQLGMNLPRFVNLADPIAGSVVDADGLQRLVINLSAAPPSA